MYYKVEVKCGHVGRNNYILKLLFIKAMSRADAAKIAKNTPRVKHHHKDVVRSVIQIEFEEYIIGLKSMDEDMYFKINNSTDQRLYNCVKPEEIHKEEQKIKYKNKRNGQRLKNMYKIKEMEKEIVGGMY